MLIDDFVSYFKMTQTPFTNGIDSQYLYQPESFISIQSKLTLAIKNNSFALLTGAPGTGKSTLLRSFTQGLDKEKHTVLYVSLSNATPRWLYTVPLEQMGVKPKTYVNDARMQLHKELEIQRSTYGRKVIIIFDEAHLLANRYNKYDLLEEIRFLLNGSSYDSGSPLTLILAGQTELWSALKTEKCKAITQRVVYFCNTTNLTPEQVPNYIASHMKWSGCFDNVFSYDAVERIAELSEGNPRIINKICMHSLNYAALKHENTVSIETVLEAANNEVIDVILKNAC